MQKLLISLSAVALLGLGCLSIAKNNTQAASAPDAQASTQAAPSSPQDAQSQDAAAVNSDQSQSSMSNNPKDGGDND